MASNISSETHKRLILDNAVVQVNYTTTGETLGVSRGGASFTIERDIREVEIDGTKGPVKGLRRIIDERAMISGTLIEFTSSVFSKLLPESAVTTATTTQNYDSIASTDLSIENSDYLTDVAIVGTVSGSTVDAVCIVKNALSDDNMELATEDQNEGEVSFTFTGHYNSTDLNNAPWEIRYPSSTQFST